MAVSVLIQVPFAIVALLNLPAPTRDCQFEVLQPAVIEERALGEFHSRIAVYVALQRRLARATYPMPPFDDEGLFDDEGFLSEEFREAMIAARPLAREGDFFTPGVRELFRTRIDVALAGGLGGPVVPLYTPLPGERAPAVNGPFSLVRGVVQWPELVPALPALPKELGYAFWGRDLVLVDVVADLVLDILPEALPEGARPGVIYQ